MAVVDRVSKAMIVVEGIVESEEVKDSVDEEKTGIFGEISLVGLIFDFFSFPGSTGGCDVAIVVLAFVDTLDTVGNIEGVSEGLCGMET